MSDFQHLIMEPEGKHYSITEQRNLVCTLAIISFQGLMMEPDEHRSGDDGDFNTFNDRGVDVDGHVDVLNDNVTFMNGIRWKLTRQKMTPLFTAAKLRNMYYIMDKSGRDFVDYLQRGPKKQAFDILSTYCSASIAASVFGIHTEKSTMDSPFLEMAQKARKAFD
ncbi:Cytochrome P450 6B7 [Eumeta japonica]|uniref:unspecific monooxygenase n=1 Tax=Eumeta variegata TaxID=151549 RepID=A0A4C2A1G7_EUMVA|nr:Cytochrome P450 6B7 [Eumeta japonica]